MGDKMKLNRKGFMLAEVVVSASVVAVVLVTMYIGINRMTAAYDKRNRYYDLDAQQVAMEVNDAIKRGNDEVNFNNTNLLKSEKQYPKTKELFDLCNKIYKDKLDGEHCSVFIVTNKQDVNNKTGFDNLKDSDINQSFKDYLDYFVSKTKIGDYSYFVVVELEKNNNYYYYTLKVK